MPHRTAAISKPSLGAFDLGDPKELLAKFVGRNLEIELVIHPMNAEKAALSFGIFGDDFIVRLDWFWFLFFFSLFDIVGFVVGLGFAGGFALFRFRNFDPGKRWKRESA